MTRLIGEDIKLMRARYDEALEMQGIECEYQYPVMDDHNDQMESVADHLSVPEKTYIFFEGNPKVRTFKRFGWVVENSADLPFLIHCSFNLEHVQRDCVFTLSGMYTELAERKFRVTEITYDIQAPDHLVCQVVPVYEKQAVGRTKEEVARTFDSSSHFIKQDVDYRGQTFTSSDKYRLAGPPSALNGRLIGESTGSNMLKSDNSGIRLTRGDSAYLELDIRVASTGQKYVREDGDVLTFTVKPNYNSHHVELQKEIEGLALVLDPADTAKMSYGEHWFDVQLTTANGNVYTVVGPAKFILLEEVTF